MRGGRGICTHTFMHACTYARRLVVQATWTSGSMSLAGLKHAWAHKGLFVSVWLPGVPAEHSAMEEVPTDS